MNKTLFKVLVISLGLLAMGTPSQAALTAVDPGPYTAGTGFFPVWYEDATGLQLEICLSQTIIPSNPALGLAGGPACLLNPPPEAPPPPQLPFDPALPVVFPFNFPDEAFWATADATIDDTANQGTVIVDYVSALEAAFAGGPVLNGDQISFARIRIRVEGLPATGIYTITHPFGVDTFDVQDISQKRDINFTEDRGIGRPGTFGGALAGRIGPFLQRVGGRITVTDPVTGATEQFIGDPNTPEPVTGSPFGTNFVRIQGPGVDLTTNLFNVSGKVFGGAMPTELTMQRSTYKRTAAGATSLEVFAGSTQPDATLSFRETIAKVPVETSMNADGVGNYFGQDLAPSTLPPFVVVTAVSPTATGVITPTPTSLASQIVDVVKIHKAQYSIADQTLVIEAGSSDELVIPTLRVVELPGTLQIGSGTTTQQLVVRGVVEPPATVTVKSSAGGADTEPVAVLPVANANPIAVNDSRGMVQGTAQLVIDVLTNDSDPDNNTPLTVVNLTQPAAGTVSASTNGTSVTYTPQDANFTGTATFTYQAQDTRGGLSNIATVTVTVSPPVNNPPIVTAPTPITVTAQLCATSVPANQPAIAAFLAGARATDPDVPGSVLTVTNNAPANFPLGITTVTFTAFDALGLPGTATSTVTVNATPNTAPVVTAPAPITITVSIGTTSVPASDPAIVAFLAAATATDPDFPGSVLTVTNNAPASFPLGTTTVTFSAVDSCSQTGTAISTVTINTPAVVDLDIQQFQTTNNVRVGRGESVAITLRVRNQSAVDVGAPARVVGTLNGSVVYDRSQTVNDPPGGGTTSSTFPAFIPNAQQVGTINWVATISDTNPDVDQATATSRIRP